jgi:site-specific recombinase XerD
MNSSERPPRELSAADLVRRPPNVASEREPIGGGEGLALHVFKARAFMAQARTRNTRRAYFSSFTDYADWCNRLGLEPLSADPQLIGMYLAGLPERRFKYATIRMRLSAIAAAHRSAGLALDLKDPRIARVMEGIARSIGTRAVGSKPVLADELAAMVRGLPATVAGTRDRALLLIGFGAAMRRSELVALNLDNVAVTDAGLKVLIRFSKADQVGAGAEVGIHRSGDPALCPVRAFQAWLDRRGPQPGPLFCRVTRGGRVRPYRLSDRGVVRAVKSAVVAIGLDPERYAGHSLRAGLATSASNAGADLLHIMKQTRHRSVETVRRYVRDAEIWRNNVTRLVLPPE